MTHVGSGTKTSMAQRFKETFSYEDVRVHFVGAWYVMAIQNACKAYADSEMLGIPFRLSGWRVVAKCFPGLSTG